VRGRRGFEQTNMPRDLSLLEGALGICFRDKTRLRQAFTHRSYLHENPSNGLLSNERLEFLGDAVLGFIVARLLYERYPDMAEGSLTGLRSALVKSETLADLAARLSLGEYLYLSRGEEASGGRARQTNLARAFEALVGAIFLDQGLRVTRGFLRRLLEPEMQRVVKSRLEKDYKSRLQELVQGDFQYTPVYGTVQVVGPDHAREFTVQVEVLGRVVGRGTGRSKQAAEQAAAKEALANLLGESLGSPLPAGLRRALFILASKLAATSAPWAIGGSSASLLQGMSLVPVDIDILTSADGAYQIGGILKDYERSAVSWRECDVFKSHLGRFEVAGVPVEVMGGLVIAGPGGIVAWEAWKQPRLVSLFGLELPVVPLEAQLVSYSLIPGREARVREIATSLRQKGYDSQALENALNQAGLSTEASTAVRSLLLF